MYPTSIHVRSRKWIMEIQVLIGIFCMTGFCESQVLTLCEKSIKGETCSIGCETPDLLKDVSFHVNGAQYAICLYFPGSPACSTGPTYTINQAGVTTFLNITALDRSANGGTWLCKYGTAQSSTKTLTVYTEPSASLSQDPQSVDFSSQNSADNVSFEITTQCSSPVSIKAVFVRPDDINTGFNEQSLLVTGSVCPDNAESTYTASFTLTKITGQSLDGTYKVLFKISLVGIDGSSVQLLSSGNFTFPSLPSTTVPPTTVQPTPGPPINITKYIIIGVAIAVAIILALVVFCVWHKRKQKPKTNKKIETSPGDSKSAEANGTDLENVRSNIENTDSEIKNSNL